MQQKLVDRVRCLTGGEIGYLFKQGVVWWAMRNVKKKKQGS